MTHKNDTVIYLSVTTESVPMSVDTTEDESILTIALVETPKPSYKPAGANTSYSLYTPRTSSTSAVYPSSTSDNSLTSSSKIPNMIEPIQEGVKKMSSESSSYIYVHTTLS